MYKYCFRIVLAFIFIWNNINLLALNNYNLKRLDFDIPIADNSINSMLLDNKNSIWFFNSKGLYKYNGSQLFQINNKAQNGHILNGLTIYSISYIRNSVYVCTNQGVYNVNESNLVAKVILPITKQPVCQILSNSKNHLILLTKNGQLVDYPVNGLVKFLNLSATKIGKMIILNDTIFVSGLKNNISNSYIFKISPFFKIIKEYFIYEGIFLKSITSNKNSLFCLTKNYVLNYNPQKDSFVLFNKKFKNIDFIIPSKIKEEILVFENPNNLSIGKNISDLKKIESFNKRIILLDIIENPLNGSYFIGTNSGLYLLYKTKLKFEIIEQEFPGFKSNLLVRRQVLEDAQNLYFLYYGGILKRNKANQQFSVLIKKEINAYAAFMDEKYMWIGADGGSFFSKFEYNKKEKKSFFKIKFPNSNTEIVSILNFKNNNLLLGCCYLNKLLLYNTKLGKNREIKLKEIKKFSNDLLVRKIINDSNGNILVATNHGLIVLNNKFETIDQITNFGYNNIANNNFEIHDIYIANNNNIFLATDDGLVELNYKDYYFVKNINLNKILNNRKCIFVTQDYLNRFWIATYKGLYCYDDQLKISEHYSSSDGLPDDEYNFNACKRLDNGNIIFGGLNAYIMINPADVKFNRIKNALHFSEIYSNLNIRNKELYVENINTLSKPFVITKGKELLTLKFSMTDYLNAKECNYWYKINNQLDWINIGNSDMLQLWNLPKGENNILIKGENSMGISSPNSLSFNVFVAIPFYEENWFISLFVIFVILMFVILLYIRFSSYNKLREIKKELLYDIHDELGGILTKTSMRVELISLKNTVTAEDLRFIVFNVKEALQSVRNVLWSLDSESSNIDNLLDRTRANLNFIFKGSAFDYLIKQDIDNKKFEIPIETKRNILLIIKEAATNTLKHSNGNKFMVTISKKDKKYLLQISDNGNCSHLELNCIGYGFKSLEKRAESINGKLKLYHNETGFFIELLF